MVPRRVAAAAAVLPMLLGGCVAARPTPADRPSAAPTTRAVTVAPGAAAYGSPLAWVPDGIVTAVSAGEAPSALEGCPSPQPRFEVTLHAAGGPRVLSREPGLFEPAAAEVSPDGTRLAVLGFCAEEFTGVVGVVPLRPGAARLLRQVEEASYGTPFLPRTVGWLPDGRLLAMRLLPNGDSLRGEAVAADERLVVTLLTAAPDLVAARALPGGALLLLKGGGGSLRAEVAAPGREPRTLADGVLDAVPSPDGRVVAALEESALRLVPVAGGAAVTARVRGDVTWLRWSPRSDRLIVLAEDGEERLAYVVAAGGAVREVALPGLDDVAVWSPDGDEVAYGAGDEVRVASL